MPSLPGDAHAARTPNPLLKDDPELAQCLSELRRQATDMLLDQRAAVALRDPAFRAEQRPHAPDEVEACLQVLRVLTKATWDANDLRLLDAFWRTATHADLFADACEADRHRIHACVENGRRQLLAGTAAGRTPASQA